MGIEITSPVALATRDVRQNIRYATEILIEMQVIVALVTFSQLQNLIKQNWIKTAAVHVPIG